MTRAHKRATSRPNRVKTFTALINGLDPYRYLEYALKNVRGQPIEAILPYSKDLEIR
jgi:hypothetical protein